MTFFVIEVSKQLTTTKTKNYITTLPSENKRTDLKVEEVKKSQRGSREE